MLKLNDIHLGDCLQLMQLIPDKSIDMILCDLPYGITDCGWDQKLSLPLLWGHYKRIIKDKGAIILTATNPFAAELIMSNKSWYRHEWIWKKNNGTTPLTARFAPLRCHELVLVFGKSLNYYPQMTHGKPRFNEYRNCSLQNQKKKERISYANPSGLNYPKTVQTFKYDTKKYHTTQKPVALCSYLIRTYTKENDIVLDNCAGSGTTGVACKQTNRQYLLIEKDPHYYQIAKKRLERDVNLII